jgi:hypothetical protein
MTVFIIFTDLLQEHQAQIDELIPRKRGANIFQEASTLLRTKNGRDMSEEEAETLATAMIPLMLLPQYSDLPIVEGLEELGRMLEEAK